MDIRKLKKGDSRKAFASGNAALDDFFHKYASQNQFRHFIGTTYVAFDDEVESQDILGYATVSAAQIHAENLPSGRSLPRYPAPVLRIARLAVSQNWQGRGVGGFLLAYCMRLGLEMRERVGCVGIITDAKPDAVAFYAKYDFVTLVPPNTPDETTLMFAWLQGVLDQS